MEIIGPRIVAAVEIGGFRETLLMRNVSPDTFSPDLASRFFAQARPGLSVI
jgi:hypothetical protein